MFGLLFGYLLDTQHKPSFNMASRICFTKKILVLAKTQLELANLEVARFKWLLPLGKLVER
jgi:hypothetical protein